MTATYRIEKTPAHLVKMGTAPYIIRYYVGLGCDWSSDWEYERRAKVFHETEAEAHKAGKRYLKKMKDNGFEV
jgi:hypothetical protein